MAPRIPFGNSENIFARKRNVGTIMKDIYNEFKRRGVKFGGVYMLTRPVFFTVDPEVVRSVLAKDFRYVIHGFVGSSFWLRKVAIFKNLQLK